MSDPDAVPVLVVEDNLHLRTTFVLQLNALGIKADSAANGAEALSRIHSSHYGLIMMDVQMPEMNGLEATAAIRSYERTEQKEPAVIVAVTAGGASSKQCIEAGMNDYFEKPLDLEGIKALLKKWAPNLLES
ncbi:MAG: response regulator [Candidatus Melainabacteria bacterium]|nr:response regulator [Candidatus Melainabacteria bacterium]